jgi:hypothetical protein
MAIAIVGTDGNTFTTRDIDASSNNFVTCYVILTPSGSYVTGGDTVDLTAVAGLVPSGTLLEVDVIGQGNTAGTSWTAIGNYYAMVQGATLAAWKLQMWSGGGVQLAAGAYPATVTNDKILAKLVWRKLL